MATQIPSSRNRRGIKRKTAVLISIITFIIVVGSLWLLSIEGVFPALWSSLIGAIFTIIAVIIALLQWDSQRSIDQTNPLPTLLHQPQRRFIEVEGVDLVINKRRGALIVKVRKNMCGVTLNLSKGFDSMKQEPDFASCVVERRVGGHLAFVAIFPSLEPGNYTIHCSSPTLTTRVTIYANLIVEVDWRRLP